MGAYTKVGGTRVEDRKVGDTTALVVGKTAADVTAGDS